MVAKATEVFMLLVELEQQAVVVVRRWAGSERAGAPWRRCAWPVCGAWTPHLSVCPLCAREVDITSAYARTQLQEALVKGLSDKVPKVVAASVDVLHKALTCVRAVCKCVLRTTTRGSSPLGHLLRGASPHATEKERGTRARPRRLEGTPPPPLRPNTRT